jgi:hypothetical protein
MGTAARTTQFPAWRLAKSLRSSSTKRLRRAKARARYDARGFSVCMLIKSNTTGVRWLERHVSRRVRVEGDRLH